MKQTLYRILVPDSVREKIYEADVRYYQIEQHQRRLDTEAALPRSELSQVYIENLRILVDRNALLKEMPKRARAAEIGAGAGDFSNNILLINNPSQLYLIDLWPEYDWYSDEVEDVIAYKFKKEIEDSQVLLDRGTPLSALANYDDDYLDWVYVNSEPTYEMTTDVLELCRQKVKNGGIIAGNNYVTCDYIDMVRYGVIQAVHNFCKKHSWEMIYLTHESHRRLSYALRRIGS